MTLGPDGVAYKGRISAGHHVDVISTHGAGDMFVGALAAGVTRGAMIPQAIDFAQAAAALHVSSDLDARATLCPDDVHAFLEAYPSR